MRRKDKEITDQDLIQSIIRKSIVCRLAMTDGNHPYIVPLCFGFKDNCLYFHCAKEGKKIDLLKMNDNVCFEFDVDQEVVPSESACMFGMKFFSVIGFGRASFIEDDLEKEKALDIIMQQYSDKKFDYMEDFIQHMFIIKVDIDSMTGKQSKIQE
jgi:nitroimidazol reductase NimA-like FMN-containing flavoprotein (pyridoxamine 5'-phosphate oxidase superfamily)